MSQEQQDHRPPKAYEITVDKKLYKVLEQFITGSQIKQLAQVDPSFEVWLKINGPGEDKEILDQEKLDLAHEGVEHFFTEKPKVYTIIVNGQKKTWPKKFISFDEIVKLAFPTTPAGQNILFSVSYEDGPPSNPQGTMIVGDRVKIKDGMVFNVTPTDRS